MKSDDDHLIETYRSLLSFGLEALKGMLLLNGGAVVALLAYIGQIQTRADLARRARLPVGLFVGGLVCTMLAFGFAYLTQHALLNEDYERPLRVKHQTWQWLAVLSGILSLVLFCAGAWTGIYALAG